VGFAALNPPYTLPADGPTTLNGLLLEKLETMPEAGMAMRIGNYMFEITQTTGSAVRSVKARMLDAESGK
jgi:Mg2+/Co2+ transporter CorB